MYLPSRRILTVLVLASSSGALAHDSYVADVPNGADYSCTTCHGPNGNYADFNSFGDDFKTQMHSGTNPSPARSWAALFDVDSDGDGQTNGEELGDPCGLFSSGSTAARTTDVSQPGDLSSTSADPFGPDADADEVCDWCDNCPDASNALQEDADADGTGDACDTAPTEPGCTCAGSSSNGQTAGALGLLGLLGLVARRRR